MSFGFSAGDFIAVGKLVAGIVSSLRDSGGSRTDYQHLIRELECLQATLIHLDKLAETGTSQDLAAIKYAALSCRRPLEEFIARIRKYDKSLGTQPGSNVVKRVIDKIKYPLAHKNEVQKLQAYLSVHIGTINILLAEHGLEKMQLASEKTEITQVRTKEWLESTSDLLGRVRTTVASQTDAVLRNMTMLEKVYKILSGELKASLQSFEDAVAKVWYVVLHAVIQPSAEISTTSISTQQIYAVVLEIRTSIASSPDVRWTFFQDPLIVEDALGRKFPVPSEYDYPLLDAIIKQKFQDGPGALHVAAGDYELMYAKNRLHILSVESRLMPGRSITMAVLVDKCCSAMLNDECCPMPQCQSRNTTAAPGGGRQCCDCAVWFDQSKKRISSLGDLWAAHEMLSAAAESNVGVDGEEVSGRKRKRPYDDDFSIVPFKNVKLAAREAASEIGDTDVSPQPSERNVETVDLKSPGEKASRSQSMMYDVTEKEDVLFHAGLKSKDPVDFNQAISYIKKIKSRFQNDPGVYKQFLETLQAYQRDQTAIKDVYYNVRMLLHSAPDLVEDFKQFLPESANEQIEDLESLTDEASDPPGVVWMVQSPARAG
ncbi:hypothetical protein F5Y05DRAFT_414698 [Hypoxylon sp. FL0543]|nr:hypothetical protein F5Y05DRAFT_414698 [Hypoxylon sp. FL0543]